MSSTPQLRDTHYATEIASASIGDASDEGKIERLFVKGTNQEEIRFSWWVNGGMIPRPLDLSEDDLIKLLRNGIAANVVTPSFRARLRELFSE